MKKKTKATVAKTGTQESPEGGKFSRKVKKFKELEVMEFFYLPNYRLEFEEKYRKVSDNTYYNVISKEIYWTDGELNVDTDHVKSEESEK